MDIFRRSQLAVSYIAFRILGMNGIKYRFFLFTSIEHIVRYLYVNSEHCLKNTLNTPVIIPITQLTVPFFGVAEQQTGTKQNKIMRKKKKYKSKKV